MLAKTSNLLCVEAGSDTNAMAALVHLCAQAFPAVTSWSARTHREEHERGDVRVASCDRHVHTQSLPFVSRGAGNSLLRSNHLGA